MFLVNDNQQTGLTILSEKKHLMSGVHVIGLSGTFPVVNKLRSVLTTVPITIKKHHSHHWQTVYEVSATLPWNHVLALETYLFQKVYTNHPPIS